MFTFGKPKIDMSLIRTTSKDTLKRTALFACGGDVKAATEIYEFFVKDMESMPDYDATPPSFMDQAKATLSDVFGFVDANQDKLIGAWNIIQQMRGGGSIPPQAPPTNLPPI
jgi:hypothetical protein